MSKQIVILSEKEDKDFPNDLKNIVNYGKWENKKKKLLLNKETLIAKFILVDQEFMNKWAELSGYNKYKEYINEVLNNPKNEKIKLKLKDIWNKNLNSQSVSIESLKNFPKMKIEKFLIINSNNISIKSNFEFILEELYPIFKMKINNKIEKEGIFNKGKLFVKLGNNYAFLVYLKDNELEELIVETPKDEKISKKIFDEIINNDIELFKNDFRFKNNNKKEVYLNDKNGLKYIYYIIPRNIKKKEKLNLSPQNSKSKKGKELSNINEKNNNKLKDPLNIKIYDNPSKIINKKENKIIPPPLSDNDKSLNQSLNRIPSIFPSDEEKTSNVLIYETKNSELKKNPFQKRIVNRRRMSGENESLNNSQKLKKNLKNNGLNQNNNLLNENKKNNKESEILKTIPKSLIKNIVRNKILKKEDINLFNDVKTINESDINYNQISNHKYNNNNNNSNDLSKLKLNQNNKIVDKINIPMIKQDDNTISKKEEKSFTIPKIDILEKLKNFIINESKQKKEINKQIKENIPTIYNKKSERKDEIKFIYNINKNKENNDIPINKFNINKDKQLKEQNHIKNMIINNYYNEIPKNKRNQICHNNDIRFDNEIINNPQENIFKNNSSYNHNQISNHNQINIFGEQSISSNYNQSKPNYLNNINIENKISRESQINYNNINKNQILPKANYNEKNEISEHNNINYNSNYNIDNNLPKNKIVYNNTISLKNNNSPKKQVNYNINNQISRESNINYNDNGSKELNMNKIQLNLNNQITRESNINYENNIPKNKIQLNLNNQITRESNINYENFAPKNKIQLNLNNQITRESNINYQNNVPIKELNKIQLNLIKENNNQIQILQKPNLNQNIDNFPNVNMQKNDKEIKNSSTIKNNKEEEQMNESEEQSYSSSLYNINDINKIDPFILKQYMLFKELENNDIIEELKNENKKLKKEILSFIKEKEKFKKEKKLFLKSRDRAIKDNRNNEEKLLKLENELKHKFIEKRNQLKEMRNKLLEEKNIIENQKQKLKKIYENQNPELNKILDIQQNEINNKEKIINELNMEIEEKENKINELNSKYSELTSSINISNIKQNDIKDINSYPEDKNMDIKDKLGYPENRIDIKDNDEYPENNLADIKDNDEFPENNLADIQDNDENPDDNDINDMPNNMNTLENGFRPNEQFYDGEQNKNSEENKNEFYQKFNQNENDNNNIFYEDDNNQQLENNYQNEYDINNGNDIIGKGFPDNNIQNDFYEENNYENNNEIHDDSELKNENEELIINEYNPCLGLVKIENPKYMNSLIQCLAHIPEITDQIINIHNEPILQNDLPKLELSKNYRQLLMNIFFPEKFSNLNRNPYKPIKFKNSLYNLNPKLQENEYINYKEFLEYLISELHNELNLKKSLQGINLINNINSNNNEDDILIEFLQNFNNENNSYISKYLYGICKLTLYCHQCQNTLYNFETFFYLYFNLSEVLNYKINKYKKDAIDLNIVDCLEYYQRAETLIGDKGIFCPNCQQQTESTCIRNLYSSKTILIFVFEKNKNNDLNEDINFDLEETINLRDYIQYKKEGKKTKEKFYLSGIVNYYEDSYGNQNYKGFCKMSKNNVWYCYDNEDVYPVDFKDIKNKGFPTILFYHKIFKK